jgi:hypothetical protein
MYWESLGVGSDSDGDDGRGIATIDGRKIEIPSWICNFLNLHLLFHIIQHNDFWCSGARRSHRSIQRPFSTLGGRLPASPRSRHTSSIATQLSGTIRNEIQVGDKKI